LPNKEQNMHEEFRPFFCGFLRRSFLPVIPQEFLKNMAHFDTPSGKFLASDPTRVSEKHGAFRHTQWEVSCQ
jgi:hypothetical protein